MFVRVGVEAIAYIVVNLAIIQLTPRLLLSPIDSYPFYILYSVHMSFLGPFCIPLTDPHLITCTSNINFNRCHGALSFLLCFYKSLNCLINIGFLITCTPLASSNFSFLYKVGCDISRYTSYIFLYTSSIGSCIALLCIINTSQLTANTTIGHRWLEVFGVFNFDSRYRLVNTNISIDPLNCLPVENYCNNKFAIPMNL